MPQPYKFMISNLWGTLSDVPLEAELRQSKNEISRIGVLSQLHRASRNVGQLG